MKNQTAEKQQPASGKTKYWILYHLGLLAFAVIAALVTQFRQNGRIAFPETGVNIVTIFLISVFLGYLASYMVKRGSKLSHKELTSRMVPYFLLFLALSIIIALLAVSMGVLYYYITQHLDMQYFFPNLFQYELPVAGKSVLIWLMLFSIVFFYILWRKSAIKEQTLREEKLKYQYQKLKAQINPHFLFNSFGTLSELVYENPKHADEYIQGLSGIYRYIIENEEEILKSLRDELDFVQQYFQLQQKRLNGKVKLSIDIADANAYQVIPVSVQSLVENAIKHNQATVKDPLHILIRRDGDYLIVQNNLQRKNTMEPTTKKGLQTLNEQVKMVQGRALQIIEESDTFIVKLPMTRKA